MEDNSMIARLIVVDVEGREQVFEGVYKDMTVERFKRVIAIRNKEPIDQWQDMMLLAFGREMENGYTLGACGLESGSRIRNVACVNVKKTQPPIEDEIAPPPPYEEEEGEDLKMLFALDLDGHTHSIKTSLDSDAASLIRRVARKTGIHEDHIRIICAGKQLDPLKRLTLRDYGIQPVSAVKLVMVAVAAPELIAEVGNRKAPFKLSSGFPGVSRRLWAGAKGYLESLTNWEQHFEKKKGEISSIYFTLPG